MSKKLLLKKYVKTVYLKNYSKTILKNDLILFNVYLKTTNNILYDSTLNLILADLKKKGFKWYYKNLNILVYKKNILISDLFELLTIKNLYLTLLSINKKIYYNVTPSLFLFKNELDFFYNFSNIVILFIQKLHLFLTIKKNL